MAHITISCDTCIMDGTAACADCVVTHLLAPAPYEHRLADPRRLAASDDFDGVEELDLIDEFDPADAVGPLPAGDEDSANGRPSRSAVVFDLDELRAMRVLAEAGLVPTLRHREAH